MALTKRSTKGSALTTAELDANWDHVMDRGNHTGTQSADTITDGATNKAYTGTEKTKLEGIASGATANSADATLLARGNHTGTQTASTISDFASTVRSIALTGLSLATSQVIAATDTVLAALGYLQAQITGYAAAAITFTNKVYTGAKETKTAPAISAGALAIDCNAGNLFAVSLNANITNFTFSNIPASGTVYAFWLEFTADGTARTIDWSKFKTSGAADSTVKWPGNVSPTPTVTSGKKDVFLFTTYDAGTTWMGAVVSQNS